MADLEFSDSIDSKESLDDHHTSLAELVFAAEQRPSGEVLVRNNLVANNTTPNFAPEGNIVASVRRGTGIMVMANEAVWI